jgi:hypothetical protein
MKKIIFTLLLFISATSYSQCTILLDDLYSSADLPYLELKTFAINNGYTYDDKNRQYICASQYLVQPSVLEIRQNQDRNRLILHSFSKKSIFTNYKAILENNGEYFTSDTKENVFTQIYLYKGKIISLTTENLENPRYSITILNKI